VDIILVFVEPQCHYKIPNRTPLVGHRGLEDFAISTEIAIHLGNGMR